MTQRDTMLTTLLQSNTSGVKLSIYQPTHPASSTQTIQEDTIRFKNALQAIRQNDIYDESVLGETMASLEALHDDTEFWKHRTKGLAVFADKDGYQTVSLEYDVTEATYVSEEYCVSPLVLTRSLGAHYYVLDVNHTRPRLLEGTPSLCTELVVKGMPDSFEAMTRNVEYGKELQHQSGGVGSFHGHSDEAALHDDTMKYYRHITDAVETHLADNTEPLILMGVENRVGSIRQLLSYSHVLEEYVEGSAEAMNEQTVHDKTLPLIEHYTTQQRAALVDEFKETPPALAITGAKDILVALEENRVETLLIPSFRRTTDTVQSGYDTAIVLQQIDETSAVEGLVRHTLEQGGAVVALPEDAFDDDDVQPRALCRF